MSLGDDGLDPGGILEQFRLLDRSQDGTTSVQVRSEPRLHVVFSFKTFQCFIIIKYAFLNIFLSLELPIIMFYVLCT